MEDRPLEPAVPGMFGSGPELQPKELPATAFYPGLRDYVRPGTVGLAQAAVDEAKAALDSVRSNEGAEASNPEGPPTPLRLAELDLKAALASLESVQARLKADEARFSGVPEEKLVGLLTFDAGLASVARHWPRRFELRQKPKKHLPTPGLPKWRATPKRRPLSRQPKKHLPKRPGQSKRKRRHSMARCPTSTRPSRRSGPAPARAVDWHWRPGSRIARTHLLSRVAVNRIWMRHFGTPLVESVFDFGLNGNDPSHPELLEAGGRIHGLRLEHEAFHRLILTSQAYRMQSWATPKNANAAIDPENRFLFA